jgi:hypothetical protein
MFWFKRKTITVDAFTNQAGVYEYFPMNKSTKHLPDWWLTLPKLTNLESESGIPYELTTMKRCPGFIDLYKKSFTLSSYTELKIKTTENDWSCISSSGLAQSVGVQLKLIETHHRDQFGSAFDKFHHMKFIQPWLIYEKTGVNFLLAPTYWNHIEFWEKCFFATGLINFKYQHAAHVNFFMKRINDLITIKSGTPLVHLIPLSEYNVDLKTHLISDEDYDKKMKVSTYSTSYNNSYTHKKNIIDERERERKCPFGFGK